MSSYMIEADFESLEALHSVSPLLTAKPYNRGPCKDDPTCHFMLVEFREVGQQRPEPTLFTQRVAELYRNSASPTGKFGFHMKTMAGPIPQHNDGCSNSWEEIFSNFLRHLLDIEGEKNEPRPELEHVKYISPRSESSLAYCVLCKVTEEYQIFFGSWRPLGRKYCNGFENRAALYFRPDRSMHTMSIMSTR